MSYSEKQQRTLLKAARDLRAVACEILDDVVNEAEFTGRSARWALLFAVRVVKEANTLAGKGYEQCPVDARVEAANRRSGDAYRESLRRFHVRLSRARGITMREAEELTLGWIDEEDIQASRAR